MEILQLKPSHCMSVASVAANQMFACSGDHVTGSNSCILGLLGLLIWEFIFIFLFFAMMRYNRNKF